VLNHICEEHESESIGEILDVHNSDLHQLEELTGYANKIIERHRKARSIITEVVEMVPTSNNPSLRFKEFVRKKRDNNRVRNRCEKNEVTTQDPVP